MTASEEVGKRAVCRFCGANGYFGEIAWYHDEPTRHKFVPFVSAAEEQQPAPKPIEPAQVESGDGVPLPELDDAWKEETATLRKDGYDDQERTRAVLHCRERQLTASLQRERELREEVERLKGMLRNSYPYIYFAAQEHAKQGRPNLAFIAEFINLRIDEVFKAATTAEKVSSR